MNQQEMIDRDSLMGEIAAAGVALQSLIESAQHRADLMTVDAANSGDFDARMNITAANPEQWILIARQNLQVGLDALRRAVVMPTHF